jgi:ketosteroid isomerase-like protein
MIMSRSLFFTLAIFGTVNFWGSSARASVTADLTLVENKWVAAYKSHDIGFLKNLLADEYTYSDGSGVITNKNATIEEFTAPGMVLTTCSFRGLVVKAYGDTALVRGTFKLVANMGKQDLSGTYVFMDVFVKKGGQWRAVATLETPTK